jgi:hypothetical protein
LAINTLLSLISAIILGIAVNCITEFIKKEKPKLFDNIGRFLVNCLIFAAPFFIMLSLSFNFKKIASTSNQVIGVIKTCFFESNEPTHVSRLTPTPTTISKRTKIKLIATTQTTKADTSFTPKPTLTQEQSTPPTPILGVTSPQRYTPAWENKKEEKNEYSVKWTLKNDSTLILYEESLSQTLLTLDISQDSQGKLHSKTFLTNPVVNDNIIYFGVVRIPGLSTWVWANELRREVETGAIYSINILNKNINQITRNLIDSRYLFLDPNRGYLIGINKDYNDEYHAVCLNLENHKDIKYDRQSLPYKKDSIISYQSSNSKLIFIEQGVNFNLVW